VVNTITNNYVTNFVISLIPYGQILVNFEAPELKSLYTEEHFKIICKYTRGVELIRLTATGVVRINSAT